MTYFTSVKHLIVETSHNRGFFLMFPFQYVTYIDTTRSDNVLCMNNFNERKILSLALKLLIIIMIERHLELYIKITYSTIQTDMIHSYKRTHVV